MKLIKNFALPYVRENEKEKNAWSTQTDHRWLSGRTFLMQAITLEGFVIINLIGVIPIHVKDWLLRRERQPDLLQKLR